MLQSEQKRRGLREINMSHFFKNLEIFHSKDMKKAIWEYDIDKKLNQNYLIILVLYISLKPN